MHSSHAARRRKTLRLLQNTWVTRNIAVTQSVYRESYQEERVHAATRTVMVGIDLDGIAFGVNKEGQAVGSTPDSQAVDPMPSSGRTR